MFGYYNQDEADMPLMKIFEKDKDQNVKILAVINSDGSVDFGENHTPAKTARMFWSLLEVDFDKFDDDTDFIFHLKFGTDPQAWVKLGIDGIMSYGPEYEMVEEEYEFFEALGRYCPIHLGTANSPYTAF